MVWYENAQEGVQASSPRGVIFISFSLHAASLSETTSGSARVFRPIARGGVVASAVSSSASDERLSVLVQGGPANAVIKR